jgi:hypothetical protein
VTFVLDGQLARAKRLVEPLSQQLYSVLGHVQGKTFLKGLTVTRR